MRDRVRRRFNGSAVALCILLWNFASLASGRAASGEG